VQRERQPNFTYLDRIRRLTRQNYWLQICCSDAWWSQTNIWFSGPAMSREIAWLIGCRIARFAPASRATPLPIRASIRRIFRKSFSVVNALSSKRISPASEFARGSKIKNSFPIFFFTKKFLSTTRSTLRRRSPLHLKGFRVFSFDCRLRILLPSNLQCLHASSANEKRQKKHASIVCDSSCLRLTLLTPSCFYPIRRDRRSKISLPPNRRRLRVLARAAANAATLMKQRRRHAPQEANCARGRRRVPRWIACPAPASRSPPCVRCTESSALGRVSSRELTSGAAQRRRRVRNQSTRARITSRRSPLRPSAVRRIDCGGPERAGVVCRRNQTRREPTERKN